MNAQEEKINWAPGATEYEWTSPCKHNLIKYIAIEHPIPDIFKTQLIEAGLRKDYATINRIEHLLRAKGLVVIRKMRPVPLSPSPYMR